MWLIHLTLLLIWVKIIHGQDDCSEPNTCCFGHSCQNPDFNDGSGHLPDDSSDPEQCTRYLFFIFIV